MMTMHRLGAGDGYRYLTDQVAKGDGAKASPQNPGDYYMQTGNPAGRWLGHGCEALGVEGRVGTKQMHNLYGLGLHPDTGVQLGRRYALYKSVAERTRDRIERAEDRLGHAVSVDARAVIEREEIAKGERQAVAGFDCVFSPVKSVSLAWALASDEVAREVEAAHHAAVEAALGWLERDVAFARIGAGGVAQVDVAGVTVAAFDHRSSRAGDPDLHTHAVVSNKVLGLLPDGSTRWLTLDSQAMYKAAVAASERYNRSLEDELTRRLGWGFEVRADQDEAETTAIRELRGVPLDVIKGFSARRAQIEAGYARLLTDYHREHGITPDRETQYRLAQQATLADRPAKELAETVAEERARWRGQADAMLDPAGREALAGALQPAGAAALYTDRDITDDQVQDLARAALDDVTARRSTWTVRHVQAAAQRATRGYAMASPAARDALARRIVDTVLTPLDGVSDVVQLDPPELVATPPLLRRKSAESVFTPHASTRYTTRRQLEAEDALLEHAARTDAPRLSPQFVVGATDRLGLTGDQLDAVARIATSEHGLSLLIGPAGTGKTTTVKGLVEAWKVGGGRVHGLAPTAVAAAVLKSETGMDSTETIHRWSLATDGRGGFAEGDLVVVDEAGMVGTGWLLEIADTAREAGAKVALVGDYRQLSAVESGGALRLLATDAPDVVAELSTVWRFADVDPATGKRTVRQWEADASLAVRDGHADGLEAYFAHDRVTSGAEAILADQLYEQWREEETSGLTSVMLSASNDVVAELGRRARADLVAAGRVEETGVVLADGNLAGVGDVVVTRRNNRLLKAGREFVKNGDLWQVTARHDDGSLTVRHVDHGGVVALPADYVAERVEQGYAMTVHRAQGSTVDVAHALVDSSWSRELLYVAMTRGRLGNHVHAVTDHVLDPDVERPPDPDRLARAVLADVLRREAGDVSATETLRDAQDAAGSMATLLPRFRHAAEVDAGDTARDLLQQGLSADLAGKVTASAGWPALADRIRLLAERGVDVDRVLAQTVDDRGVAGAVDVAAVLHSRLTPTVVASRLPAGDWLPPAPDVEPAPEPADVPQYLAAMRQQMLERVSALGATAAFETPEWTRALPAVPGYDDADRADWERLAGFVAAYREAYDVADADPLGPMPKEPRQVEAHAQLAAAIDEANRARDGRDRADADQVAARLDAARDRLAVAEGDYWTVERAAPDPLEAEREQRRVESARRMIERLELAEAVELAAEEAGREVAVAAGELARQRMLAQAGGRTGRDARRALPALEVEVRESTARRDQLITDAVDAGYGLPVADARAAARADAARTLARAEEVAARLVSERAVAAQEHADRRAAAATALGQARAEVAALEARADALGLRVQATTAPVYNDDDRRPEIGDDGRDVER